MKPETIAYGGWKNCLRLANNQIELIATTDVGPRILRFGFIGGVNEFVEYPEQLGVAGGGTYRSYGGHRLWAAPETHGWTNHPDNDRVEWTMENDELVLRPRTEEYSGLQKEIRAWLNPNRNHARIAHCITNRSEQAQTLAPWALSVMAPGGRAVIPQEPHQPHSERVLPVRPVVLWGYTEMQDARWTWGNKFIQLRQDRHSTSPQKFGALITSGWSAYANGDRLFIKRFPFLPNATYPDFGCNAEFFTNARMLEVESLGPLVTPGYQQSVTHVEEWFLFKNVQLGTTDDQIAAAMKPVLEAIHE